MAELRGEISCQGLVELARVAQAQQLVKVYFMIEYIPVAAGQPPSVCPEGRWLPYVEVYVWVTYLFSSGSVQWRRHQAAR